MAIITIQSATINDPSTTSGKLDLSIQYRKILSVLLSKKVALINATVENRDQIDSGTAIYFASERNITQDYLKGTGANDVTSARTIQVTLDKAKEINFEVETLDLKRLGAKLENNNVTIADELVGQWIDAKAKAVEVYLLAKLLQLGVNTAKTNGITTLNLPAVPDVNNYRQNIWLPIVQTLATLKSLVTDELIGLDEEDFYLWVSPRFKNYILLATTNLGSDISTKSLIDGKITEIGGIKCVESTFLGNSYPAKTTYPYGSALDKQDSFDFSSCDAILIHKETVAFPFNRGQENVFVLQGNGNIKNFHKFLVNSNGGIALRPNLAKGYKLLQSGELKTYITTTALGNFVTGTGAPAPSATFLEQRIALLNSNYVIGIATLSAITTTTATATGVLPVTGTVSLTYTTSAT